MSFRKK